MEQKRPPSEQPINGQSLCAYANHPFGWIRLGQNGCAVLAIYNALLLRGTPVSLEQILHLLDHPLRPRFFGVRPGEVHRCLSSLQVPHQQFYSSSTLEEALKDGGIAIVIRWNRTVPHFDFTLSPQPLESYHIADPFGGAHCMALTHHRDGQWTVFNRYSNRSKVYRYNSFSDFMENPATFLAGFLLMPTKS